jgi:hypothetical protein
MIASELAKAAADVLKEIAADKHCPNAERLMAAELLMELARDQDDRGHCG